MQYSVMVDDQVICVDGLCLHVDWTNTAQLDEAIWAIQFNGNQGEIEFRDGTANEAFVDQGRFSHLIDAFDQERARLAQAEQDEIEAVNAARTYRDDRAQAYPSTADQLDMQYWDQVNGTHHWRDAITSVKTTFPKPTPIQKLIPKP